LIFFARFIAGSQQSNGLSATVRGSGPLMSWRNMASQKRSPYLEAAQGLSPRQEAPQGLSELPGDG